MKHIYETASDLHIRGTYVYVKSTADGFAYADAECTKNINCADLTNVFNMGTAIVVDGGNFYRATSLSVAEGVATLTYVKANSSNPTLATVQSKEEVAA